MLLLLVQNRRHSSKLTSRTWPPLNHTSPSPPHPTSSYPASTTTPIPHHHPDPNMSSSPPLSSSSSESDVSATCSTYNLTTTQFHTLHTRSAAAKATAYCPYSRFRVGCSILASDDQYIDGANVENAAYPVGTCAERVAFGKAVTEGGHKERKYRAVAVATDISPPASPCGMCRQL